MSSITTALGNRTPKPFTPVNTARRSNAFRVASLQTHRAPDGNLGASIAAVSLLVSATFCPVSMATGIESLELPTFQKPEFLQNFGQAAREKEAAAEEAFRNSDTLKQLLERSEANRAKNRREVQNKYCYRQAEWGVGDCGGLNDIPGLTQNGKQETPDWLAKILGVDEQVKELKEQQKQQTSINLEELLGPKPAF